MDQTFTNEARDHNSPICVQQTRNLIDVLVLICEEIANGDCTPLAYWKICCVLRENIFPLGETESLGSVQIRLKHPREIGAESIQHPVSPEDRPTSRSASLVSRGPLFHRCLSSVHGITPNKAAPTIPPAHRTITAMNTSMKVRIRCPRT